MEKPNKTIQTPILNKNNKGKISEPLKSKDLELEAKKATIEWMKYESQMRKMNNKCWLQKVANDSKCAILNKINELKQQSEERDRILSPKKYFAPEKPKCVLKNHIFNPKFASFKAFIPSNYDLKNKIPIVSKNTQAKSIRTEDEKQVLNLNDILAVLGSIIINQSKDTAKKPDDIEKKIYDKLVIAVPKLVKKGEEISSKTVEHDNAENFSYYKLDPNEFLGYLKENANQGLRKLSLKDLKKLMSIVGKQVNDKEEENKYKDALAKKFIYNKKKETSKETNNSETKNKRKNINIFGLGRILEETSENFAREILDDIIENAMDTTYTKKEIVISIFSENGSREEQSRKIQGSQKSNRPNDESNDISKSNNDALQQSRRSSFCLSPKYVEFIDPLAQIELIKIPDNQQIKDNMNDLAIYPAKIDGKHTPDLNKDGDKGQNTGLFPGKIPLKRNKSSFNLKNDEAKSKKSPRAGNIKGNLLNEKELEPLALNNKVNSSPKMEKQGEMSPKKGKIMNSKSTTVAEISSIIPKDRRIGRAQSTAFKKEFFRDKRSSYNPQNSFQKSDAEPLPKNDQEENKLEDPQAISEKDENSIEETNKKEETTARISKTFSKDAITKLLGQQFYSKLVKQTPTNPQPKAKEDQETKKEKIKKKLKEDELLDEGNIIAQAFQNQLEQKAIEERDRWLKEDEEKNQLKNHTVSSQEHLSQIIDSSVENVNVSGANLAEMLKKHLLNAKFLERILRRLRSEEQLQNYFLQYTDDDVAKQLTCNSNLNAFFSDSQYEAFHKSNLKSSAFFPDVEVNQDQIILSGESTQAINKQFSLKRISILNQKLNSSFKKLRPGTEGTIQAIDYWQKFEAENKFIQKSLEQEAHFDEEILNEIKDPNLRISEKIKLLKMRLRKANVALETSKNELLSFLNNHSQIDQTKQIDGKEISKKNLKSKKKSGRYQVDMNLINIRDKFTNVELMERQYQILKNKKLLKRCSSK